MSKDRLRIALDRGFRVVAVAGALSGSPEATSQPDFKSHSPLTSPLSSHLSHQNSGVFQEAYQMEDVGQVVRSTSPPLSHFQQRRIFGKLGGDHQTTHGESVAYPQRGFQRESLSGKNSAKMTGYRPAPKPVPLVGETGNQGGKGKMPDVEAPVRQQAREVVRQIQGSLSSPFAKKTFGNQGVEALQDTVESFTNEQFNLTATERLSTLQEMQKGIVDDLAAQQEVEEAREAKTIVGSQGKVLTSAQLEKAVEQMQREMMAGELGVDPTLVVAMALVSSDDKQKKRAGMLVLVALASAGLLAGCAGNSSEETGLGGVVVAAELSPVIRTEEAVVVSELGEVATQAVEEIDGASAVEGEMGKPVADPVPLTVQEQPSHSEFEANSQFDVPTNHALIRILPNDTLLEIAMAFGTDVETLKNLNGIDDPRLLQVGQPLLVSVEGGVGGMGDRIITEESLEASGELIFVAAPRPDLPPDQDFTFEELREVNRFFEEKGSRFLDRLYGPAWLNGVAWVRKPSPEQVQSWVESQRWDVGGCMCEEQSTQGELVNRLYMMPFDDWREDNPVEKKVMEEAVLVHEQAHFWLLGIEAPPFDQHNIVRLSDGTWVRENVADPQRGYITLEYYLHLSNPTFFRDLFSLMRQSGKSKLTEVETLEFSEQVMPGFGEWLRAFHSTPEVPHRSSEDLNFTWDFKPPTVDGSGATMISWFVPVSHVRDLGISVEGGEIKEREKKCIADWYDLTEDGLHLSFCHFADLPYPQTPDNAMALPFVLTDSRFEVDGSPSFGPPFAGRGAMPGGRWVSAP